MDLLHLFLLWTVTGLIFVVVILGKALVEANRAIDLQHRRVLAFRPESLPRPEWERDPSRN